MRIVQIVIVGLLLTICAATIFPEKTVSSTPGTARLQKTLADSGSPLPPPTPPGPPSSPQVSPIQLIADGWPLPPGPPNPPRVVPTQLFADGWPLPLPPPKPPISHRVASIQLLADSGSPLPPPTPPGPPNPRV